MRQATRSPEQLARGWHAALVGHDPVAFAELFAPDGVMVDVEHRTPDLREARPIRGREAIHELAVGWLRDTPEFRFEITGLLADESTAAYRWTYEVPGVAGDARRRRHHVADLRGRDDQRSPRVLRQLRVDGGPRDRPAGLKLRVPRSCSRAACRLPMQHECVSATCPAPPS